MDVDELLGPPVDDVRTMRARAQGKALAAFYSSLLFEGVPESAAIPLTLRWLELGAHDART